MDTSTPVTSFAQLTQLASRNEGFDGFVSTGTEQVRVQICCDMGTDTWTVLTDTHHGQLHDGTAEMTAANPKIMESIDAGALYHTA